MNVSDVFRSFLGDAVRSTAVFRSDAVRLVNLKKKLHICTYVLFDSHL